MYKFMRKFPGGLLLFPMLLSAIFYTFTPNLFRIGGLSQAFFTTDGLNYVVAAACFFSGAGLKLKTLGHVLKKQGTLLLTKTLICIVLGYLYLQYLGPSGIFGISAIAFIIAISSTNPSLYLALESDLGTKDDTLAFGLVGLLCVPAYPMFIYGVSQAAPINWMPIISTLIPIVAGMIIGNLDEDMANFLTPGVVIVTPLMGWSFGAGINLLDAVKAGPQGILLTIAFYIAMLPILFSVERNILHADGIATISISSIAGMSVSVPAIMVNTNPEIAPFVSSATAQITLGVVLTSIVTPVIAKKLDLFNHPEHGQNNK